MNYQHIVAEMRGQVAYLTLNRPETRNALSQEMVGELLYALADLEQTKLARAVVLRGAGGHFCAGADLKDMATARARLADDPLAIMRLNRRFGELCAAFAASPMATLAVLEGGVMGGGFGLACCVDVALAEAGASFRLSETSLGLVPAQIAPYLVERLGYSQARRLAVTGGRLDGTGALRLGLVHECHDDTEALEAALTRNLDDILACAPDALTATKALVRKARFVEPQSLMDEAATVFARAAQSDEGAEGIAAFLQKRKAKWVP